MEYTLYKRTVRIFSYIKSLMDMKQTQLVAYYISKLNPSNQVLLYATYLEKIVDSSERKEALMFAENSGLDVFAITRKVVENIRNYPHETEDSGNLQVILFVFFLVISIYASGHLIATIIFES